jgi:hypothetical protein
MHMSPTHTSSHAVRGYDHAVPVAVRGPVSLEVFRHVPLHTSISFPRFILTSSVDFRFHLKTMVQEILAEFLQLIHYAARSSLLKTFFKSLSPLGMEARETLNLDGAKPVSKSSRVNPDLRGLSKSARNRHELRDSDGPLRGGWSAGLVSLITASDETSSCSGDNGNFKW